MSAPTNASPLRGDPVGAAPRPGQIRFRVLAEIAEGETARIDLCREVRADDAADSGASGEGRLLAVKRLHPHIAEDEAFAAEFHDEVWLTAALRHPNVIEVRGWGIDDYGAYLAVELVEGVSLARLLKTVVDTGEVFTERMVVYVAACICRALAVAHELRGHSGEHLGLVHRDLTPGNVLVGFNGEVKVADFGLAKAKQRLTRTLTGYLKGQPAYMAPEIARAQPIDCRADLFSLGVVVFELLAGRRPWVATGGEYELISIMQTDPPADLRELRPKLDRELVAITAKLIEPDVSKRFADAGEVLARLDNWLSVHGYAENNDEALARFVRRNAMRQKNWFERAIAGQIAPPELPVSRRPVSLPVIPVISTPESASAADHIAAMEARASHTAPKIRHASESSLRASNDDPGEEIPTLVHQDAGEVAEKAKAVAAARRAVVDYETDASTVDVPHEAAGGEQDPLGEAPTVPVKKKDRRHQVPKGSSSGSPDDPPTEQGRKKARASSRAGDPAAGAQPTIPTSAQPTQHGAPSASLVDQSVPSQRYQGVAQTLPLPDAGASRPAATLLDAHSAVRATENGPDAGLVAAARAEHERVRADAAALRAEAERLTNDASRMASAARLAEDASACARDAVDLAQRGAHQGATQRLDEARGLAARAHSEASVVRASRASSPGPAPAPRGDLSGEGRATDVTNRYTQSSKMGPFGIPFYMFTTVVAASAAVALLLVCVFLLWKN